jgi:hypothetical protein
MDTTAQEPSYVDLERCHSAFDDRVFVVFLDDALEAENMTRLHPIACGPLVSVLALSRCELKRRAAAAVGTLAHQGEAIPSFIASSLGPVVGRRLALPKIHDASPEVGFAGERLCRLADSAFEKGGRERRTTATLQLSVAGRNRNNR